MDEFKSAESIGAALILGIISIAIVLTPSFLIYKKYGLPEAAAYFVLAATLMEIRSRLAQLRSGK